MITVMYTGCLFFKNFLFYVVVFFLLSFPSREMVGSVAGPGEGDAIRNLSLSDDGARKNLDLHPAPPVEDLSPATSHFPL